MTATNVQPGSLAGEMERLGNVGRGAGTGLGDVLFAIERIGRALRGVMGATR